MLYNLFCNLIALFGFAATLCLAFAGTLKLFISSTICFRIHSLTLQLKLIHLLIKFTR